MSFDPELMYAPLTAAWPERGLEESTCYAHLLAETLQALLVQLDFKSCYCTLTVGPVLAKTKGKDADRPIKPSNPAATNLLLLGDRTRLLMLQHMQNCTQVNLSSDRSLDAEY